MQISFPPVQAPQPNGRQAQRPGSDSSPLRTLTAPERATQAEYERNARAWSDTRTSASFWQHEFELLHSMLGAGHVLDVGSGNGRDATLFTARGYQLTGVDISPALLTLAAQRCPAAAFTLASVYELPFPDASFDGAWVAACLLHLPRRRLPEALSEIHRVLKPDAAAFISVKRGRGDATINERYFTFYEPDELAGALTAAGFAVERRQCRTERDADWLTFHARRAVPGPSRTA